MIELQNGAANSSSGLFMGEESVQTIYLGENTVSAIYLGEEQVFSSGPVPTGQPNNEIWYESTEQLQLNEDGITWGDEEQTINRSIVSHTFADGKGVITFDGDVVGLSDFDYGGSVFTNYDAYTEETPAPATKISLPTSIRYIGGDSFFHYDNLEEIAGFENVTSMDEAALEDCGLYDLPALDNCDIIPDMCMQFWLRMETMNMPENITHIGYQAFSENTNLVNVYCHPTVPPTTNGWEEDPWEGFVNCNALEHIYVPAGSVDAYKTAEGWRQYADIIQAIEQ